MIANRVYIIGCAECRETEEIEFTLKSASEMMRNHFQGIVEMDETYFRSTKREQRKVKERIPRKRGIRREQVCVFVTRDRDKVTFLRHLGGYIDKRALDKAIGHKPVKREWMFYLCFRALLKSVYPFTSLSLQVRFVPL